MSPPRFLVVDDEPIIADTLATILRCVNSQSGLRVMRRRPANRGCYGYCCHLPTTRDDGGAVQSQLER